MTGLEAPMFASLRFTLEKGRSIPGPQYRTPAPLTPRVNSAPFYGTTGVGGDLYVAAQDAVRAMVDHISKTRQLGREDAYLLCSLVVDLKISEIVDAGQYIVSAVLPEAVFTSRGPDRSSAWPPSASRSRAAEHTPVHCLPYLRATGHDVAPTGVRIPSSPSATRALRGHQVIEDQQLDQRQGLRAMQLGADRELAQPPGAQVGGEVHALPDRLLDRLGVTGIHAPGYAQDPLRIALDEPKAVRRRR